jgi:Protein of unknown function (DUF2786)
VNEKKESVMTLVMKLLTLAEDEGASPHERALAQERADRLMAQHMIEEHEARMAAERAGGQVRKPTMTEWEIVFEELSSDDHSQTHEFQYQLITIMREVLDHCNIRVNDNYKYKHGNRIYQLVGFPEDVMYAERVWFNIFKAFVQNVNPQWDNSKTVGENAYNFASAGLSWPQICLQAEKAGDVRVPWVDRWQCSDPDAPWYTAYTHRNGQMIEKHNAPNPKDWNPGLGAAIKLLRMSSKTYAIEHQLSYSYARGKHLRVASRNSFAQSYRSTICQRLRDISAERTKEHAGEKTVDADKFALALVDTRQRVDEEFYRVFPQYDPEVRRKQQEEADFLRAAKWAALTDAERTKILRDQAREQAQWERQSTKARRSYRAIREDPRDRYDHAAWSRGRTAAQKVNLRADEEVDEQTRKELG